MREFALCYSRHPWDVRVKGGSERKFVTSDKFAKIRIISVSVRSGVQHRGISPRGTPKSHLRIGESGAKKLPISTPHPASELGFLVKKSFATVRACGASIGPNTASAPETAPRTSPNRRNCPKYNFWSRNHSQRCAHVALS